nr:hypothetical protein [uncultured Pseudomonas sp.]
MKTRPVNTSAAQSPGPHPSPMETARRDRLEQSVDEFERVEHITEQEGETPPPQTWKHPDDGKSLSEKDEEIPLKP